jgi:hypothetical protein
MLEALDGFWGHVNGRSRFGERESEQLEFLTSHHPTLLLVHDQAKRVGQETCDRCHNPLGTTLRFREDRTVIRVPHERQTTPFQLLVQVIQ